MPVFRLSKEPIFPHPELANEEGIVAIGGDLSPRRLLAAYCNGIFPWFSEDQPILWWSPDPRCIIFPEDIKVSRFMQKLLRKGTYKVTFDTAFRQVITCCAELRTEGTWITQEMHEAYCTLHSLGYAHSVEVWYEERLVGGLYGVSLGSCFFGESMFSIMDNTSKTALITLAAKLKEKGFTMIDCQVHTQHLESMGAVNVPRSDFLHLLAEGLEKDTFRGNWSSF